MNRRPLLLGAAVAAAAVLVLSGCASNPGSDGDGGGDTAPSGPDYGLVTDGTLTICSEVPYVPFEFEGGDNGTGYTGFDIDLTDAIAKKLDLKLSVQDVSFDGLQSGTTLIAPERTASIAGFASVSASTYHWSVSQGSITTPDRSP